MANFSLSLLTPNRTNLAIFGIFRSTHKLRFFQSFNRNEQKIIHLILFCTKHFISSNIICFFYDSWNVQCTNKTKKLFFLLSFTFSNNVKTMEMLRNLNHFYVCLFFFRFFFYFFDFMFEFVCVSACMLCCVLVASV